jgi:hypothetical protein
MRDWLRLLDGIVELALYRVLGEEHPKDRDEKRQPQPRQWR